MAQTQRGRDPGVPWSSAETEAFETVIDHAEAALAVNRTQSAQNDAIIAAANTMLAFGGTTIPQTALISTLKDLATGIKVLAQHDQANKAQLNALIRLAVGALDGTD
jgi:hypothetical protein